MTDRTLIVGLGNPGKPYQDTRHNIGWAVLDVLAGRHRLAFDKQQHRALLADGSVRGVRVLLAKPQTYMNLSGQAVGPLLSFYKIPLARLLVVNDDMDIPFGALRLRGSGSAGGQRGLGSILQVVGTQEVARVRVGIGRPPGRMEAAAYVLQTFRGDEAIDAARLADRAADAVEAWLTDGLEAAMTRYNGSGAGAGPAT